MKTAFVLLFCFAVKTLANLDYLDNEVELQCIQHCPIQNRTDTSHYEYACDYKCNIYQCARGCKLWRNALRVTCQEACNGTTERLTPKELYCVMGCNDATTKYFSRLRVLLGIPPAPALMADSRTATSLKLKWNFPEANKAGLSCYIQWKYEELSASWQYCQNATWDQEENIFYVKNLQPYTKYRFRVALVLGYNNHHHGDPIVSSASVVISTKASGVPASPPTNVRATPVDSTSISISWEPGPFPHGPLLSYVLQITDNYPEVHSEVKDISPDTTYYMVRNLKPLRNYTINMRMRNNYGAGPAASAIVSTPAERQVKNAEEPVLILGTEYSIFELTDVLGEPVSLYTSKVPLRGIALHISKKLIFVADVDGYLSRMTLDQPSKDKIHILKPQNLDFIPLDLTVDWLNDQLYILGEVKYQISRYIINRCNLDGSGLTVAYAGLNKKPFSIQIDPLSGYLFWTIQDYNSGGLYRLDISDISNGIKHDVKIKRILNETELGAFTIDHTSFNLLVSYQRQNTVKSVTLNGQVTANLRPVVTHSQLQKVLSLTTANKKFYWTDGIDVFYEEYHKAFNCYFHNTIPHLTNGSHKKVSMNLPSSQPWPVPINPPKQLQAIFGRNIAKTRWQPPELLGIQSKGAWQNWSYEISIKDLTTNKTVTHNNINTTSFTIKNLNENTDYILKVAAYTKAGKGPWSSEFQGTTLNRSRNPIILWSAAEGLLQSNAAGENVETIIHRSLMKSVHFTDMAWFKDQIYLVTNDSHVYWYNMTSHKQERIIDMDSVGSIAVDWIGKKLYWSNPKQQLIIRGNLNGTQQEPLLTSLAKELNIDSIKAYLYWSTGIKVECSHLNGVDKIEYHNVHFFSGKQVMGLTLDMDQKYVYWIVRGSEGSNLYKAPMQGHWKERQFAVEKVSSLRESNMQGPLCYFHKRLIWLQDDRNAAISDLTGTNIATISGKSIWGLNMVYVVDASLHILPDDSNPWTEINVIPDMIDKSSVKVIGSSESFNITWSPITNVNYGIVFYEVQINNAFKNDSTIINTTNPTVKYWRQIAPFTRLNVTIRAYTYWGTSPQVRAEIFSPPSTPSAPRNLRVYVIHGHKTLHDSNYVSLIFRWDYPLYPNGVLQGFKVRCWYMENDVEMDICGENTMTMPTETQYNVTELPDDEIYYFEVQAFTEIGSGALSDPISVNSSHEWPLPTLLIASLDSLFIHDIDANQSHTLINDIITPVDISYLMKENTIFWINKKQEFLMYNILTSNLTKVFDLTGKSNGLTLDWVERSLYYVETPKDITGSFVYKVDLNDIAKDIKRNVRILSTKSNISKIEVSPFTKKLYWIEAIDGVEFKLMQSNTNGKDIKPFFSQHNHNKRDLEDPVNPCNCPFNSEVGSSFTVDHSDSKTKPLIIFIDPHTPNVVSTDKDGCFCNIVANNTIVNNTFPLDRIKSDFGTLYWTNPSQSLLYALKRKEANLVTKEVKVSDINIYGQHMQPYPPKECLSPKQHHNFTVTLNFRTDSSLNLKMPDLMVHEDCFIFSMAPVMYTVFYREYDDDDDGLDCAEIKCDHIVTFETDVEIGGLKPFTKYVVSVAISNHFTDIESILIGPPSVFQTAPGVPSKPRNVSALVLNPTLAKVQWLPPEQLNGLIVYYEVHWQTKGALSGVRQKGEQPVTDPHSVQDDNDVLETHLRKLSPNETYTVWVRAYSENNKSSSDSYWVQITTYPEPSSIILVNKTAYYMNLSWEITQNIDNYTVEYTPITSNTWNRTKMVEINDNVLINVENLKPKSQYKFRMTLLYENDTELYVWPTDSRFTFETLGDRPTRPGMPIIQYIKPNVYKVWWELSKDNGAPIELYKLEAKILISYRNKRSTNRTEPWFNTSPSIELEIPDWETVYNGTDTSWIISGLNEKEKYAFRVSALNSYGWSDTSEESNEFDLSEAARLAEKQDPMNLILIATTVPISIFLLVILTFSFVVCSGKSKQKKLPAIPAPLAPDVELATLRELPRRGIHNTNILYVSTQQTPEEITLLPHIKREKITLTKFLGSGAFGEVFEGEAKGIGNENGETKVAVKTLKKGASDQEKTEFLQEAQLMSHFKHEHILQLLGVCLDNDPHFIIMELMQGGDLLTYLRNSRKPATSTPPLTLIELLKMCVDVSKGCRYLEEMHYVHRDLACRNCLVSSIETESRIVKIGDFGLARDIYKNDYYRKEGEGLLPVRWMAPESLVDGVFTSQSDVWAFGVLLWEIMTLGQQPYPGRANMEVLHYVRKGGRLGKPTDCPEELHNLMLECWKFDHEKRPSFKYCFEVLENLHRKTLRNPTTGAHEGKYISTVPELFAGISNAAYFRDENYNSSGNSWKSDVDDEANKEKTPFLSKTNTVKETPKYLELIYDPESELENDGYEIPRTNSSNNLPNGDSLVKIKDNQNAKDSASTNNKVPYHNVGNNLVTR